MQRRKESGRNTVQKCPVDWENDPKYTERWFQKNNQAENMKVTTIIRIPQYAYTTAYKETQNYTEYKN